MLSGNGSSNNDLLINRNPVSHSVDRPNLCSICKWLCLATANDHWRRGDLIWICANWFLFLIPCVINSSFFLNYFYQISASKKKSLFLFCAINFYCKLLGFVLKIDATKAWKNQFWDKRHRSPLVCHHFSCQHEHQFIFTWYRCTLKYMVIGPSSLINLQMII